MTTGFAPNPGSSAALRAAAWATRLHGPGTNSANVFHRRPAVGPAGPAGGGASPAARFFSGFRGRGSGSGSAPNRSGWTGFARAAGAGGAAGAANRSGAVTNRTG